VGQFQRQSDARRRHRPVLATRPQPVLHLLGGSGGVRAIIAAGVTAARAPVVHPGPIASAWDQDNSHIAILPVCQEQNEIDTRGSSPWRQRPTRSSTYIARPEPASGFAGLQKAAGMLVGDDGFEPPTFSV